MKITRDIFTSYIKTQFPLISTFFKISLTHIHANDNDGFWLISGRLVGSSISKKEFDYYRFQIAKFYETVDYQITNKSYKKASKRIKEGRAWIQVIIACMHE
jgi:hypothetical protein